MKHIRKELLSRLFKSRRTINPLGWSAARLSFSIYGEDVLLDRLHSIFYRDGKLLHQCPPGFYVDIGSNHPIWHSNTYMFYLQGWKGICVDINKKLIAEHRRYRPDDLALNVAISEKKGEVTCYQGEHDVLAGLNREVVLQSEGKIKHQGATKDPAISSFTIQSIPLTDIFKEHLQTGQIIDILSVDCEGEDLAVLRSNDWTLYRPRLICVEDNHPFEKSELVSLLQSNEYQAVIMPDNRLYPNYIFADARSLPAELKNA
jgi:FkbM family methyltransferase